MAKVNKSYRIRANINRDSVLNFNMTQTYDKFDILSLTLNQQSAYRLMESDTGVIAGRVLANGGFGIPNAKISVFIEYEDTDDIKSRIMYHYTSPQDLDYDGIKYNLLSKVDEICHQDVGTFPTKRIVLDNNDWIDIFDKYYTYTTRTNNAGDYMIYGVPTGMQKVHMDVDLSDIGVLSQTPRDMMYKGYNADLFDSPTKFKKDTNLLSLVQIMSQDNEVFVYPFWGDTTTTTTNAAITRCDINLSYKFEPTCIFMGSVISDTGENALSKKCIPAKQQGKMSELMTGEGKIEMIRKTYDNKVESYSVKGDKVINDNGVWCYQIPMNLDYVVTDEFGNTVLSDNPDLGIPTRTRVRFRISMSEAESDSIARKRARYLVPNNPRLVEDDYPEFYESKDIDYEFGTKTKDEDFRDLMWNNVYTVKNYIPRLQKSKLPNNLKHTGIKMVNHSGSNNPMPYNNLRIKFNFTYKFLCVLSKILITIVRFINTILTGISAGFYRISLLFVKIANKSSIWPLRVIQTLFASVNDKTPDMSGIAGLDDKDVGEDVAADNALVYMLKQLCANMRTKDDEPDKWNFNIDNCKIGGLAAFFMVIVYSIGCGITLNGMCETDDGEEINVTPGTNDTIKYGFKMAGCKQCDDDVARLYNCIENQLAQDNEVTSFNFYNDWINGVLYFPLWYRKVKPKKNFLGIKIKAKDQYCATDPVKYKKKKKMKLYSTMVPSRTLGTQTSANPMGTLKPLEDDEPYVTAIADDETGREDVNFSVMNEQDCYGYSCHTKVRTYQMVKTGFIHEKETMLGDLVQYYRPSYFNSLQNRDLITLFATDIVLLGSLNSCDLHGIPQFFKALESTTYNMPPDLMSDDYEYKTDNYSKDDTADSSEIDESTRHTEYTGADWGDLGVDQSNMQNTIFTNPITRTKYTINANENKYDNGGLFYGITCFDSYTKPKSVINLIRICEFGVSLDESQEILNTSALDRNSDEDTVDNAYSTLTPDGFVSYDEIYNPDYRSMFATMNANFLKTKLNNNTGLTEYDFTHLYIDNFDGSLSKLMKAKTVNGTTEQSNYVDKANYVGNYNLERSSDAYLNFRFGNYTKGNSQKIYYYDYDMQTSSNTRSAHRIPRYENSFYFYFGLNEGKTAIDVFNTDYFSDCTQKDITEGLYSISYQGNSWCPIDSTDGYIAFNTTIETPIKVVFADANNPEHTYTVSGITTNKFYIGTVPSGKLIGYTQYSITDDLLGGDPLLIIPNGKYNMTMSDGDGIDYKETIEFNYDYLSYDADSKSFSVKNSELDDFFEVTDSEGSLDWSQMFPAIANYGTINPLSGTNTRNIHGYITLSNISVDDYIIRLVPTNAAFFEDDNGQQLYSGLSVEVQNGTVINTSGDGYMGRLSGTYYFGVPYGEQKYTLSVTQCCIDDDGNLVETANIVTTIMPVREGLFKMYLNGVDYDNIRNFRSGWTKKSTTYERFVDMRDNISTFDSDDIYGWNDVDNIGKYASNSLAPTMSSIDVIDYTVSVNIATKIGDVLSDSYLGNGVPYKPFAIMGYPDDYSNPYTWNNSYCYTSSQWITDRAMINSGNTVTFTDSNNNTSTVSVTRYDTIVLDVYTAEYKMSDNTVVATEDTDGTVTYSDGYSDLAGPTFMDYRTIIDNINEIIEKRQEYVKTLKGALRISHGETLLTITYKSNETPIKFLIAGNGETTIPPTTNLGSSSSTLNDYTPISNTIQYYVDTAKIFDSDLAESSVTFVLPTLTYGSNGWTKYEKPTNRPKHPYYVAIQDNNDMTIPSKSNTPQIGMLALVIDNFGLHKDNPYLSKYSNSKYNSIMFGVHFYDKAMYSEPKKILCAVDSYPVYGSATLDKISLNGFVSGYTYNGFADAITTTLFDEVIDTYTQPSIDENIPLVKRVYYTDSQQASDLTFGIYDSFDSNCTEQYQYIESNGDSGNVIASDGYGEDYSAEVSTVESISLDGTVINNTHDVYSDSDANDDYISLSVSKGNGTYYIYRWDMANHPFDMLVNGKYAQMPSIFVDALTGYAGKTSSSQYNIGQLIDKNNTNRKFFLIAQSGAMRMYTPVFDMVMPRAIRFYYTSQGSTRVDNKIYFTERKRVFDTATADIANLYYIENYDFNIIFKVYNTDTNQLEESNRVPISHSNVEIVNIHVKDTNADGQGNTWEYDARAIKVTLSDDIQNYEHPFLTDMLGISKACSEQSEVIVTELS